MGDDDPKAADSYKSIDHSAEAVGRDSVVNQQTQERSCPQAGGPAPISGRKPMVIIVAPKPRALWITAPANMISVTNAIMGFFSPRSQEQHS